MNAERLTKNERREQAREQARLARVAEQKREKRRRLYWQGGVVVGVLAVLAVVALVLIQTMKPAGPGPENMASGGVVFQKDLAVVAGPGLAEGGSRVAPETDRENKVDLSIYVDYACPHCSEFETAYGDVIENWVGSGDATLEIYPVNILGPSGSSYSTKAANAVACLVDQTPAPGVAFTMHNSLLSDANYQKAVAAGGMSDDQFVDLAEKAGFSVNDEYRQCLKDIKFSGFISQNTKVAVESVGVLGLADGAVLVDQQANGQVTYQKEGKPQFLRGTPLVVVNGKEWRSDRDGEFGLYLAKVKSELPGNKDAEDGSSGDSGK